MVAIIKVLLLLAASLIAATSGKSYPASKLVEFVHISVAVDKQVVTIELKAEDVRLFSPEASQFINRVDLTGKYSPINEAKYLSKKEYKQLHYAILNALKKRRRNGDQQTPEIYDNTTNTQIDTTTKVMEATTEVITSAKTSTPEPTTTMQETTTTMQETTTTTQEPTTTVPESITTMQEPTTTMQESTTTMQEPTTKMEEPTTTMQEPTTTMQEPITTMQEPTTTMQEPTTTMQEPTTKIEEPTTTMQESTTTMQEPTMTMQEPTTTMQEPTTTMQEPTTTMLEPTTTMQEPTTTMLEPTTTTPEPTTTMQEPTTTMQEPKTTTPEPTTSESTTPQPTTAMTAPTPPIEPSVNPNKRRRRDASPICDYEKEYSEKDLFFVSLDDVFKDDILRIPIVLHRNDCVVPEDLLFDVSQELNSTGDLEHVVGKEVENIYRGLPVDVVVEIKAVKVSSHHFWLPILLTISFVVVLVVLSAIYCLVFWKRKSYAVQQENYIAVKGRDNPLTDIEMMMDEGPVYVHTNGHVHHAPIILTDDDGRIVPMSEFNDDEPPHQTNLTKDSTIL